MSEQLSGWGRFPRIEGRRVPCSSIRRVEEALEESNDNVVVRGAAQSYGDASLLTGGLHVDVRGLDRVLSFDRQKGILRAEAGLTVGDLLEIVVPAGWFPPVLPGTERVTLAGLVASDVHGKNHHRHGSMQDHLRSFCLLTAAGEKREVTAEESSRLFAATCGGMGLTGVVLEVELALKPIRHAAIDHEETAERDLESVFDRLKESAEAFTYTVAWLDGTSKSPLGRGTVLRGNHVEKERTEARLRVPSHHAREVPRVFRHLLTPTSVGLYNRLRWGSRRKTRRGLTDVRSFFFPLDGVRNWNRLYDPGGFLQYQFCIPAEPAPESVERALSSLQSAGHPPYLVVLKDFGEGHDLLSFPQKGYTLSLDLPVKPGLETVLETLDALVIEKGGRVYLSKDARLPRESFRAMYPNWRDFLAVKQEVDPDNRFSSDLAKRLGLES